MPEPPFSWHCPFCNQNATIISQNYSRSTHMPIISDAYFHTVSEVEFIVCPNPDCQRFSFKASLHKRRTNNRGANAKGVQIEDWPLIPASNAKVFPDYVPQAIRNDYNEACQILQGSPKASSTLSRRALQGMIRDFWSVEKQNLYLEIEAIKDKIDSLTWAAIDGVREIGNIGAHMEKDIDLIVDVEPEEAGKLIWLIETLMKDWYVDKHEKEERLAEIADTADGKQRERRGEGESDTGDSTAGDIGSILGGATNE